MKFNFTNIKKFNEPYPFVEVSGALEEGFLDQIVGEFPSSKQFGEFESVMGGRRRLSSDDPEFYNFIRNSAVWESFYNLINCKEFVESALKHFDNDLLAYESSIDVKDLVFDDVFLRNVAYKKNISIVKAKKKIVSLVSSKTLLRVILARIIEKISSKLKRYIIRSSTKVYVHFDISTAHNGYEREIHHDNDDRVIAMVFYLSSHVEDKRTGGEFCIHKYKKHRNLELCEAHPDPSEMVEVVRVLPEKNKGVMFLSTPNSYHSVPLIKEAEHWRKFIYVGITIDRPKAWSNSKNSYDS